MCYWFDSTTRMILKLLTVVNARRMCQRGTVLSLYVCVRACLTPLLTSLQVFIRSACFLLDFQIFNLQISCTLILQFPVHKRNGTGSVYYHRCLQYIIFDTTRGYNAFYSSTNAESAIINCFACFCAQAAYLDPYL